MDINSIINRNFTSITDKYRAFALCKDKCRKCAIYEAYSQVGQSEGNAKDPTFMIVGEALGEEESEQVRPFVGEAGRRLKKELRKYPKVFRRDSVIITNVLACRPKNNNFPSGDHNPHVRTCTTNWLINEIQMLKPKVIITLGNPALKAVRDDWGITANRGKWKFLHEYQAWSFATYHPSYVIRSANDGKQYISDQFDSDIKVVSKMWKTMVGDSRINMNEDEYSRSKAMQTVINLGLAGKW